MIRVVEVPVEGSIMTVRTLPQATLQYFQDFVGGPIEWVHFLNALGGYVHEEGLLLDLPVNRMASSLYQGCRGVPLGCVEHTLHGPVVLTGGVDEMGGELSVPTQIIEKLATVAGLTIQEA